MAAKKKSSSKKPADKKSKTGFFPKVKSTKKNGLGTY